jgi:hypothetical protein
VHEPYCFTGLTPGTYRVILNPPPGYTPSGPAEWPVSVAEGYPLDIQFGNTRSESSEAGDPTIAPTGEGETPDEADRTNQSSPISQVFATVAKISGIMVLALALGVAVLFVLNQRR